MDAKVSSIPSLARMVLIPEIVSLNSAKPASAKAEASVNRTHEPDQVIPLRFQIRNDLLLILCQLDFFGTLGLSEIYDSLFYILELRNLLLGCQL